MINPPHQIKDETIKFQVRYEFIIDGKKHRGTENEASWFLIDQVGRLYSHGPMNPIKPCPAEYTRAEILLKINGVLIPFVTCWSERQTFLPIHPMPVYDPLLMRSSLIWIELNSDL